MLTEKLLLLFAFVVIAPLALRLAAAPNDKGTHPLIYRLAIWFHPLAALCGGVSLALDAGIVAELTALPWLAETGLIALFGVWRFFARGHFRPEDILRDLHEIVIDAGLAYTAVGGAWFVIWRFGWSPFGFGASIIILTALHFHYISLCALVIAGMVGRRLDRYGTIYQVVALGLIVAPQFVAGGITISSVILELIGAVMIAASLLTISAFTLMMILLTIEASTPKLLLGLSSVTLILTMTLAVGYPLGRWTGAWALSIPQMLRWHGILNALLFGFGGLLGWTLLARQSTMLTSPPQSGVKG